jgi:hypothetical protein
MAQVVECLPNKLEILRSNSSTALYVGVDKALIK